MFMIFPMPDVISTNIFHTGSTSLIVDAEPIPFYEDTADINQA